jgi:hypothetical protein
VEAVFRSSELIDLNLLEAVLVLVSVCRLESAETMFAPPYDDQQGTY